MPRTARPDEPGAVHHVMVRGIERSRIFRDDRDRRELVRRLSKLCPELGYRCYAWALMPNHVHLVVRTAHVPVSRLMARLGTGYARWFNQRHGRVGHLFQNRFRSRRVVDDADLVALIGYVCRNPLEGGLVADVASLARFPWGSTSALVGGRSPHSFESIGASLDLFDTDARRARAKVREILGENEPGARSEVASVSEPVQPSPPPADRSAWAEILCDACTRYGVAESDLRSRSRDRDLARARAHVAHRAAGELGLSGAEVARRLGLTRSAVSRLLGRAP